MNAPQTPKKISKIPPYTMFMVLGIYFAQTFCFFTTFFFNDAQIAAILFNILERIIVILVCLRIFTSPKIPIAMDEVIFYMAPVAISIFQILQLVTSFSSNAMYWGFGVWIGTTILYLIFNFLHNGYKFYQK